VRQPNSAYACRQVRQRKYSVLCRGSRVTHAGRRPQYRRNIPQLLADKAPGCRSRSSNCPPLQRNWLVRPLIDERDECAGMWMCMVHQRIMNAAADTVTANNKTNTPTHTHTHTTNQHTNIRRRQPIEVRTDRRMATLSRDPHLCFRCWRVDCKAIYFQYFVYFQT